MANTAGLVTHWLSMLLETSLPGVSAAGNVRHRSIERVASAVGEGSIAIQLIHEYLGEQWRLVTADQARR